MTRVYLCTEEEFADFSLFPRQIEAEFSRITNAALRAQKRAAYALLRYALGREKLQSFSKNSCGKPTVQGAEISISHTHGLAAIAVSDHAVGVDAEKLSGRTLKDFSFMLADGERAENIREALVLWTKKEAVFKRAGNKRRFLPDEIRVEDHQTKTYFLNANGEEYILSLAARLESGLELIPIGNITVIE
ncbi:MAG: hypothetical protein IJX98_05225 [Clostridia bacterium]|nr:hypothetical protein [Clostridia bacterium]